MWYLNKKYKQKIAEVVYEVFQAVKTAGMNIRGASQGSRVASLYLAKTAKEASRSLSTVNITK